MQGEGGTTLTNGGGRIICDRPVPKRGQRSMQGEGGTTLTNGGGRIICDRPVPKRGQNQRCSKMLYTYLSMFEKLYNRSSI
ncbi:hypothetical protein RYX36_000937 [Vicia faba]